MPPFNFHPTQFISDYVCVVLFWSRVSVTAHDLIAPCSAGAEAPALLDQRAQGGALEGFEAEAGVAAAGFIGDDPVDANPPTSFLSPY